MQAERFSFFVREKSGRFLLLVVDAASRKLLARSATAAATHLLAGWQQINGAEKLALLAGKNPLLAYWIDGRLFAALREKESRQMVEELVEWQQLERKIASFDLFIHFHLFIDGVSDGWAEVQATVSQLSRRIAGGSDLEAISWWWVPYFGETAVEGASDADARDSSLPKSVIERLLHADEAESAALLCDWLKRRLEVVRRFAELEAVENYRLQGVIDSFLVEMSSSFLAKARGELSECRQRIAASQEESKTSFEELYQLEVRLTRKKEEVCQLLQSAERLLEQICDELHQRVLPPSVQEEVISCLQVVQFLLRREGRFSQAAGGWISELFALLSTVGVSGALLTLSSGRARVAEESLVLLAAAALLSAHHSWEKVRPFFSRCQELVNDAQAEASWSREEQQIAEEFLLLYGAVGAIHERVGIPIRKEGSLAMWVERLSERCGGAAAKASNSHSHPQ